MQLGMHQVMHTCRDTEAAACGSVGAHGAGTCSTKLSILAVADADVHSRAIHLHSALQASACREVLGETVPLAIASAPRQGPRVHYSQSMCHGSLHAYIRIRLNSGMGRH